MGKSVAKTPNTDLSTDVLGQLAGDAGEGTQDFGRDDLAIPFIKICQGLSPERKTIDGIEEGDIFNNVLGNNLGNEVRIIPVAFNKVWIEWEPNRGGYVAKYDTAQEAAEEALPGNDIVETAEHYVLIEGAEGWQQALVSLKSTGHKTSKKLNSLVALRKIEDSEGDKFTPPMYAQVFNLYTVEQSNDQGDWFQFDVERADPDLVPQLEDGARLYAEAKAFRQMISEGDARADYEKFESEEIEDDDNPDF